MQRSLTRILPLFAIIFTLSRAQEAKPLQLNELINETIQNNPQLRAARNRTEAAKSRISQVTSWDAPQIGVEFYQVPIQSFPNPIKNNMETDYYLQQMIPFPGKLSAMGSAAESNANMANQDYKALERKIIMNLKSAYYDLYLVQHKIRINADNQDLLKSFVDIARKPQLDGLARPLAAKQPRAVIAIGTEAKTAVAGYAGNTPVIATMILLSDSEKAVSDKAQPPRLAGCVSLDLSVTAVCREWKQLVPGKTRVGIIRNPRKNGPLAAAVDAQASSAGCSARIVECSRPEDLLAAFLSLKNQVDFVWCMPDSALYTSATVKPLLMASLEQRLPLVGFSESFVRAGATMGVYPDFLDVGRQTAEVARKWLAGEPFASAQMPRMVRVAFNHRVARLMGLRYTLPPEGDGRVMVLK